LPSAGGASAAAEEGTGAAAMAIVEAHELPEVMHSPRVLSADLLASPRAVDGSPRGGPPAPPVSFDMGAALALVQQAKKGELAKTATPSPREQEGPGDILALAAARARQKRKAAKKDPERAAAEEAEREKLEADAAAASSLNYELDATGAFRVVAEGAADAGGGGPRGWDRLRKQSLAPDVHELEEQAVDDKPPMPGNPLRRACFKVQQSRYFSSSILLTILFNAVILALEPTLRLEGQQVLLDTSETVCNVIFSIEMVFKLMALGFCTHAPRHTRTHPPSKAQTPLCSVVGSPLSVRGGHRQGQARLLREWMEPDRRAHRPLGLDDVRLRPRRH